MARILIVDDDIQFAESLKDWLGTERHSVNVAYTAADGLANLESSEYDVLLLDWNLPDSTGVELCRKYRSGGGDAAVMMLTVMGATDSKVQALDAGADDYMCKPFDFQEMLARVRALRRRSGNFSRPVLQAGGIVLDTNSHTVTVSGQEIHLQPLEFAMLEFFMRNPNKVVSQEALLRRLWSSPEDSSTDAVYTCIRKLRQKLNESDKEAVIKTVHGVGYRFAPPPS